MPASMASLMYPATFAAMEVTHLEPALREPGATPRLSCWPWKSTRPPAVKLEPSDALTGIAERDARETRVCFTPTGARPAIVTLIAAILSNTNDETRVCQVRARGKRRGVIRARDATSRKKRVWIKAKSRHTCGSLEKRNNIPKKKPRFSETLKPRDDDENAVS